MLWYQFAKRHRTTGLPYFEVLTLFITLCLGIFIVDISVGKGMPDHYSKFDLSQEKNWHIKVRQALKPNTFSTVRLPKLLLRAMNLHLENHLAIHGLNFGSNAGRWRVFGLWWSWRISTIPQSPPVRLPELSKKQGVQHQIKTNYASIVIKENGSKALFGTASKFRENIISKLDDLESSPSASKTNYCTGTSSQKYHFTASIRTSPILEVLQVNIKSPNE